MGSCMNEISSLSIDGASSILFEYYMKEYREDMNKGFDICRAVILFKYGGYFFNAEVKVIKPYIPKSDDVLFIGVKNLSGLFLSSFIASVPNHYVLREILNNYLKLANGELSLSTHNI